MLGDQEGQPQGALASLLTPVLWWALLLLGAHRPTSLVLPRDFASHEDQV